MREDYELLATPLIHLLCLIDWQQYYSWIAINEDDGDDDDGVNWTSISLSLSEYVSMLLSNETPLFNTACAIGYGIPIHIPT